MNMGMRRALTLEAEVDAALLQAVREPGKSFKEVINDTLRTGLLVKETVRRVPPFKVRPIGMGLREGLSLDSDGDKYTYADAFDRLPLPRSLPSIRRHRSESVRLSS